jgi:hypothetical protein
VEKWFWNFLNRVNKVPGELLPHIRNMSFFVLKYLSIGIRKTICRNAGILWVSLNSIWLTRKLVRIHHQFYHCLQQEVPFPDHYILHSWDVHEWFRWIDGLRLFYTLCFSCSAHIISTFVHENITCDEGRK